MSLGSVTPEIWVNLRRAGGAYNAREADRHGGSAGVAVVVGNMAVVKKDGYESDCDLESWFLR